MISQSKMASKSKKIQEPVEESDNEDIRDKTFSLIEKVLISAKLPKDTASKIEEGIENESKVENGDFSVMLYTILTVKVLQNLKNPFVIANIKSKTWPPEQLAKLNKDELSPEKWQELQDIRLPKNIKKEKKKGVNRCKRCGSWYTTFTQAQTRSADEGITTFVQCEDCSFRYKFN
jgi:DNA-directed RNA polymerase subunit M/transcription elongation factor TFIIS